MEVAEAPIENIATLNEADVPENVAESTAPVESVADSYSSQVKKDVPKKEVQLDDIEFINAKSYLSAKISSDSPSLYDHLTSVVTRLLETKPTNAVGKIS